MLLASLTFISARPHTEKTDMHWDARDEARAQEKSKFTLDNFYSYFRDMRPSRIQRVN